MAVPKRKTSKRRKRIRRSHHHLEMPATSRCSRCGAVTRPHTVCDSCGYYRGIAVFLDEDATHTA
jgi:large subunit ribosomal protein L32